jgi:hypothetical protein
MPNCFELTRKGHSSPESLAKVDRELWEHFTGSVPDPDDHYYFNWYNIVGLELACGRTFTELKDRYSETMLPVIEYLERNFEVRCWYQHGWE